MPASPTAPTWRLPFGTSVSPIRPCRSTARCVIWPARSAIRTAWPTPFITRLALPAFPGFGADVLVAAEEELATRPNRASRLWHATGTFFPGAGMALEGEPKEMLPLP